MRTRPVLLVLGIAAILGIGGYLAYRSPLVRSWFARDSENAAEIAKLSEKKLEIAPVADTATGWPQWRGPTRDGRAPAGAFRTDWDKSPPKLLWTAPCGGGYSSCSVVGGKLYTQDRKDANERVVCLNVENGQPIWEFTYPTEQAGKDRTYAIGPRATPTVVGNLVYAVGGAGKLLCLEAPAAPAEQPSVRWQHDLLAEFDASIPQWGVACSPLIEGDLVIVQPGGKGGSVVAFDKSTGEMRWTAGKNASGYSSPVAATVAGRRMVFAFTGDALLAIRAVDGKVTDSFDWTTPNNGNIATPLVVDDYVFIASAYKQGCALLRAEAKDDGVKLVPVYSRRRPPKMQTHHSSSVFKDRYLYGFDGDTVAELKCFEFDKGDYKAGWDAGRDVGKGSIVLADKHLIIQTERGDLCLVVATPEEFRLVAKIPKVLSGNNNWASPTLVDGRLYLRDEGKIVCYDVRP